MGNTFRLWAGGVDAVEREFGDGRAPVLCWPPAGRRGDDGSLSGIRHLAQDRLQNLRSLQGAWARSADRPDAAAGALCQPEQKTLQPLDNPFGPRLSPMS